MQAPVVSARLVERSEQRGPQAVDYTLANGLRVVLLEDHSAPVVALQTWVRFGSADEAPAVAGIAHVFEHMLFKGTERFPHGEIAALIEGAGGSVNAWTSYDETVYHVTLSSRFWQTGFDVLSDAVLYSLFDATELEREKEVVLEELWRGKDNPDREIAERLFELTFTTHPYSRPVIGSEETVTRIGREDMLQVFRTWYVPNNMIFIAVGDFDSAMLRQAVQERFGGLLAPDLPARPRPAEPQQTAPRVTAFNFQAEMARVEIAFPTVAVTDPEAPALDLLSDILGSGYNSMLYTELKRRQDLAHDVYAYNYTPVDRGTFLLAASCDPEHVPAVVHTLMQQAQRAATMALAEAALTAAKTRIISHFVHARETYQGIAEQLGRYALTYGDANYGSHYIDAIAALQLDDLRRAAATFLNPQRANIALLLPKDTPLPDRHTVLTWMQEDADMRAGAPAIHLQTDHTAQVSVASLPGNRTLIVQTDRKAPLVSIRTVLDGGQRAEPVGKEGLARLCASVWDRGTELYSAAEIERELDRLGAVCSATSDRDTMQLSARFLRETFAEGLELYFDVLAHATFPEAEVERERADQLRDLDSLKENRFAFAFQHFLEAFYAPHPYGNLALGHRDSMASVRRDNLLSFHRALLQSPQAVFAVVGDITAEDVLALFERLAPPTLFEAAATAPWQTPAVPVRATPTTHVIPMQGQQTHIIWGFPTVPLRHPDRYPLRVLETILGGMGGRLFVELRDKKSLAYSVTTLDANAIDAGFLALYIGCSPDKEAEALREFARVVHDVQHAGVTAEELARAKTYLEGVLDIGLQGTSQRTAVYGLGTLQHGKWNAFQTYLKTVQEVSGAEVQRVARTYFEAERAVQVILRADETAC